MRIKNTFMAASFAASVIMGASVNAEIIYDNTTGAVGPNGTVTGDSPATGTSYEIGDVVSFAGTARTLTDWSFEYNITAPTGGNETLQAFLRALDGPGGSPGSILWDSGVQSVPTGSHTFGGTGLSLNVPEQLAWTVVFGGIDAGETSGLYFYTGPTVGTSPNFDTGTGTLVNPPAGQDFYYRAGATGWEVVTTGNLDNLGARFTAVPEPSTWALLTGGIGFLGYMARRRKA
jgi:hypothetical protein